MAMGDELSLLERNAEYYSYSYWYLIGLVNAALTVVSFVSYLILAD
jgi:hypothetical protein